MKNVLIFDAIRSEFDSEICFWICFHLHAWELLTSRNVQRETEEKIWVILKKLNFSVKCNWYGWDGLLLHPERISRISQNKDRKWPIKSGCGRWKITSFAKLVHWTCTKRFISDSVFFFCCHSINNISLDESIVHLHGNLLKGLWPIIIFNLVAGCDS